MRQAKLTRDIKAFARQVADTLPATLLKGQTPTHKPSYSKTTRNRELEALAEQSYDQLEGEWHDWLEVAKRYEHKVPNQDRYDMRHTIIIELAKARERDKKPIPILRAYKIASLTIALYWRLVLKAQVRVCLYSGLPVEPHCGSCRHKPKTTRCMWLALRPVQSLDSEVEGEEGDIVRLKDTIADDTAIDLEAWHDASTFLLGCPMRLVQIARKRREGIPLNDTDQRYFTRQRQKELKRYQLTLL